MRFKTKYLGELGEIDFTKPPFSYSTNDFSDYMRSIETSNRSLGYGTSVNKFNHFGKEFKITINIVGKDEQEMIDAVNNMVKVFEYDITHEKLAKLEVNGTYVSGYMIGSEDAEWTRAINAMQSTLTFFAVDPRWIKESRYYFDVINNEGEEVYEGFTLPMGLPTYFSSMQRELELDNTSGRDNLAKIIFYGPVTDPAIQIDEQPYGVKGTLLENERIEIDQRNKTVIKITAAGDSFSVFNDRQKSPSIFAPIPIGEQTVSYDKRFSVEIILYEGVIEPPWR